MLVIGDEDTVLGFRFAGIAGVTVEDADTARAALGRAEAERDLVLIIPEKVAGWLREDIDRIRYGAELPLIVEVPDREGPAETGPSLFRLVREAVGIRFEEKNTRQE